MVAAIFELKFYTNLSSLIYFGLIQFLEIWATNFVSVITTFISYANLSLFPAKNSWVYKNLRVLILATKKTKNAYNLDDLIFHISFFWA